MIGLSAMWLESAQRAPGYRHIIIEPDLDAPVQIEATAIATPYGPVRVMREGARLQIDIPANVTAE